MSGPTSEIASGAVVISSIFAGSITTNSVVISWTTNIVADSTVEYGTTTAYGSTGPYNATLTTSHSVTLSGVSPSTQYHFEVISAVTGSSTTSGDNTFTTTAISSGGGGGGGSVGVASSYASPSAPATPAITPAAVSSSTSTLQSELDTLLSQLATLQSEANGRAESSSSFSSPTAQTFAFIFTRDLQLRDTGNDVKMLQEFLDGQGFLVAKTGPGSSGQETTYFGTNTYRALVDLQKNVGITPAGGYFGPITRAYVNAINEKSTASSLL
jgi:hypothetical protein